MEFTVFTGWTNLIISYFAYFLTLAGAIVILFGSFKAIVVFIKEERSGSSYKKIEQTRLILGGKISIALEFLLAGDLLQTIISPGWDEIAKLAALVAIRTGLSYYLHWEINNKDHFSVD